MIKCFYIFITLSLTLSLNGQYVYDFQLEDTEGAWVAYSDIKGEKLTIIDFWATWCKPCVNSIPKLVELSESYPESDVVFIGISIDSPRNMAKVKPFMQSKGVTYPVLLDTNQEVMRELNITTIPTLLIVDAENKVISAHEGFAPGDEVKLNAEIKSLLNE